MNQLISVRVIDIHLNTRVDYQSTQPPHKAIGGRCFVEIVVDKAPATTQ